MKYKLQLLILFLFVCVATGATADASLTRQLARCAELGNNQNRLACYDKLTREVSTNSGSAAHLDFVQPPASFLDSRLVAVPWKEDYKLTVRSFVNLISHAIMDSGKHVTVQGWHRKNHDYVLNITMRTPVELYFLPRETAGSHSSMSLLRGVTMDGQTIDAGQFIMIIAAMVSDDNVENANTRNIPNGQ